MFIKNIHIAQISLFVIVLFAFSCSSNKKNLKYSSQGKIHYNLTSEDEAMLDSIQHKTFLYFLNEIDKERGIIKDRAQEWAPASIAATGFGIPSFAIAAERNWISREQAVDETYKVLNFFSNSDQSESIKTTGYQGFYYHFLELENGTREWNCELSTIDTGILMMGVIFARNYYNQDTTKEKEIRLLADKLLGRLNWNFFMLPEDAKHPNTITMAWSPEKGILDWGWHGYTEALFLYILAAGTGMDDVEKSYEGWLSTYDWQTPYEGLSHVTFPPLFGHQFSHAFIDFRGLTDKYMKEKGMDYFENSRRATLVQQQYAIENPKGWVGYDSLCWGITASDGPGSQFNFGDKKFEGYAGRGTSGKENTVAEDGTLAPYGVLSSLPFTPGLSLATIKNMNAKYGDKLWGKYGYYDSFNLTANWVDNDFIGIDQGPMLIMIENFRTGLVWNYVMKDPVIQKGLERLHFEYIKN